MNGRGRGRLCFIDPPALRSGKEAMGIELPRLEKTACKLLTACGRIQNPAGQLLKVMKRHHKLVARYRAGGVGAYVRVMLCGKSGDHLHIDCALEEFFRQGESMKPPKATHPKSKVLRLLQEAVGSRIDVLVSGVFLLDLENLPQRGFIRSLMATQGSTGLTMKLTGGNLSITGAPITNIRWSLKQDQSHVLVDLKGRRSVQVEGCYLQESLNWLNEQMVFFVLGVSEHGAER
jgi:hypothetical protein